MENKFVITSNSQEVVERAKQMLDQHNIWITEDMFITKNTYEDVLKPLDEWLSKRRLISKEELLIKIRKYKEHDIELEIRNFKDSVIVPNNIKNIKIPLYSGRMGILELPNIDNLILNTNIAENRYYNLLNNLNKRYIIFKTDDNYIKLEEQIIGILKNIQQKKSIYELTETWRQTGMALIYCVTFEHSRLVKEDKRDAIMSITHEMVDMCTDIDLLIDSLDISWRKTNENEDLELLNRLKTDIKELEQFMKEATQQLKKVGATK